MPVRQTGAMLDGRSTQALRQREERVRTLLPARMRSQSGWCDACILNISTGGLLVYSLGTAPTGSQVEIRRGSSLIIARVVWRKNQRIGLSSHGPVAIQEVLVDDKIAAIVPANVAVPVERRKQPRSTDKSRYVGRAMEFAATAVIAVTLAVAATAGVADMLSRPISAVTAALDSH